MISPPPNMLYLAAVVVLLSVLAGNLTAQG